MAKVQDQDRKPRAAYAKPRIVRIGSIEALTQIGGATYGETGSSPKNPKASSVL